MGRQDCYRARYAEWGAVVIFITQIRDYKEAHTDSEIYLDNVKFCAGLEDVGRPYGVKVYGETCIPEGIYDVEVSVSNRFGKEMILLYNTPDKAVKKNGVEFHGVRVHGGNTVKDTLGCILAMYHSDGNGKAWDRASDDLKDKVKALLNKGEIVKWVITS